MNTKCTRILSSAGYISMSGHYILQIPLYWMHIFSNGRINKNLNEEDLSVSGLIKNANEFFKFFNITVLNHHHFAVILKMKMK